jgi:hypothetical protein
LDRTYNDLAELLRSNPPASTFTPYCYQSKDADALTFKLLPDADYSERLTDHVTLFRSLANGELVGCRIKGVKALLEDLPNFIHVEHDGRKLSILLWSFRSAVNDEKVREGLNLLAKAAEQMDSTCS